MSSAAKTKDIQVAGCTISELDNSECGRILAWLVDDTLTSPWADGIAWALGHFDGGVTWGRWEPEAASWVSSHAVAPEVSPAIRQETLQELRLFGAQSEVLIWRTPTGLRGRIVTDGPTHGRAEPMAPVDETRVLRGDRAERAFGNGFTVVSDATGARQVLPIRVTDQQLRSNEIRLLVRHYFQQDIGTGEVRIALTRLVALQGGHHGA